MKSRSVLALDWSGAIRPAGKIWIAEAFQGKVRRLEPLASREDATEQILRQARKEPGSIFGLDFAFSMPRWFLAERACSTAFDLWELVRDEGEKWLRECKNPFWGRKGRKPSFPVRCPEYRRTETEVPRIGGVGPKSCFQIGGAGAVGTGSIRGMPLLAGLREQGISVWPFDPPCLPMVVEIYPRILMGPVTKASRESRLSYVDRRWPSIHRCFRSKIAASEDAFDAAVSALVMDQYRKQIENFSPADDEDSRLEGRIWFPARG